MQKSHFEVPVVYMKSFLFGLLLFATTTFAAPLLQNFTIQYENGLAYAIRLTDSTITWRALPSGHFETDLLKRRHLTPSTEILQWQEVDGSFVTLSLYYPNRSVISSGVFRGESWLLAGKYSHYNINN